MKIELRDILTVERGFIVQQVNCKHVMGGGLAAQIKNKWPEVETRYLEMPATLGVCDITLVSATPLYIANLYGQDSYGRSKRHTNYGALACALSMLTVLQYDIKEVIPNYFPYGLGCGLGGGDWAVVSEMIEFYFPDAIICQMP